MVGIGLGIFLLLAPVLLAATDRYDSTPQGAKANDIYYSLLLLYKF